MIRFRRPSTFMLAAAGVVLLTLVLRVLAIHMYDIHIDEITYGRYAQTIQAGDLPRNYDGSAFFLHPPGFLILLAGWRALAVHSQDIFDQLYTLRYLNILLAGITAFVVMKLGKFVTKKSSLALVAGLLFAVDPFIIRHNTRSLIETSTMLFILVGLWAYLRLADKPAVKGRSWAIIGLLFGLAIVTKDLAAIFIGVSLLLMALFKVGPPRKAFLYIIPAASFPYLIWISIVAATGNFKEFLAEKTDGFQRLTGAVQTTGFNTADAPSKSGTLLETVPHYASAYLIMGLTAAGLLLLLTSKDPMRRRWGCIAAASTATLTYLVLGGTFEEQFLYYLLVPNLITLLVVGLELKRRIRISLQPALQLLMGLLATLLLAFGATTFVLNLRSPDTAWQSTVRWIDNHVPAGSTICTSDQGQFLFGGQPYTICTWYTVKDVRQNNVDYVIVADKLIDTNHGSEGEQQYAELIKQNKTVYTYEGRDSGRFRVLEIQPAAKGTIR